MSRFLFILFAAGTSTASAQQPARWIAGPVSSVLFSGSPVPGAAFAADTASSPSPTHWKRGLLIGGVVGGAGLGLFVYAFCNGLSESGTSCSGSLLGGAAIGAVIGGVTGALIGGQFPKHDETEPAADSTGMAEGQGSR